MNAQGAVKAFIERLVQCVGELRESYAGAERIAPGEPLMLTPRDGGPGVRKGRIGRIGDFELHGRGCYVEFFSGDVVDFDWDDTGRESFDGWRLSRFARSIGETSISDSELVAAARSTEDLIETRPGWFVLREIRRD